MIFSSSRGLGARTEKSKRIPPPFASPSLRRSYLTPFPFSFSSLPSSRSFVLSFLPPFPSLSVFPSFLLPFHSSPSPFSPPPTRIKTIFNKRESGKDKGEGRGDQGQGARDRGPRGQSVSLAKWPMPPGELEGVQGRLQRSDVGRNKSACSGVRGRHG